MTTLSPAVILPLRSNVSHRKDAGSPSLRIAKAAATISASGVECYFAICRFEIAFNGAYVFGPDKHW